MEGNSEKDNQILYGLFLGKRYNRNQKQRFINAIKTDFKKQGFKGEISKVKNVFNTVENIYLGDIKEADTVICTYYDTPAMKLWPRYCYYPLNGLKSLWSDSISYIVPLVIYFVFIISFIIAMTNKTIFLGKYHMVLMYLAVVSGILLLNKLVRGIGNTFNYTRNTASILLMLELCDKILYNGKENVKVAFAFLDCGTSNNNGAKLMFEDLKGNSGKQFILLDCIGAGEIIVAGYTDSATDNVEKMFYNDNISKDILKIAIDDARKNYNFSNIFNNAIILTSGSMKDNEVCVYNTGNKKDHIIKSHNMENILNLIMNYLY